MTVCLPGSFAGLEIIVVMVSKCCQDIIYIIYIYSLLVNITPAVVCKRSFLAGLVVNSVSIIAKICDNLRWFERETAVFIIIIDIGCPAAAGVISIICYSAVKISPVVIIIGFELFVISKCR